MSRATREDRGGRPVRIPIGSATLEGDLDIPEGARAVVLFAHGSGSSRQSPRNRYVARVLNEAGLATLLMDLLTAAEEEVDLYTGQLRFDIGLLAGRVVAQPTGWRGCRRWRASRSATSGRAPAPRPPSSPRPSDRRRSAPSSRAAAAPTWPGRLSRGPRTTLLIVGGRDEPVIALNRQALAELGAKEKQLVIIPGATHLFEEPGALEEVARLAADWLTLHLIRPADAPHARASGRG